MGIFFDPLPIMSGNFDGKPYGMQPFIDTWDILDGTGRNQNFGITTITIPSFLVPLPSEFGGLVMAPSGPVIPIN